MDADTGAPKPEFDGGPDAGLDGAQPDAALPDPMDGSADSAVAVDAGSDDGGPPEEATCKAVWIQEQESGCDESNWLIRAESTNQYDMNACHLEGADLRAAQLHGQLLVGAHLHGADLRGAKLGYADLRRADLSGTDLTRADLAGAQLAGAHAFDLVGCPKALPDASWRCLATAAGRYVLLGPKVDWTCTDLDGVDLSGADLISVRSHDLASCPSALPGPEWMCAVVPPGDRYVLAGPGVNLVGADLAGVDVSGADLSGADLATSDLTGADLTGADLHGASAIWLKGCPASLPNDDYRCISQFREGFEGFPDEHGAVIIGPYLDLSYSESTGKAAVLGGLDLHGIRLVGSTLSGVSFTMTDLRGADLSGADLSHTYLSGALLEGADLSDANVTDTMAFDVIGCPDALPDGVVCRGRPAGDHNALLFAGANLRGADLGSFDLSDLDLTGATLYEAQLLDADMSGATLTGAATTLLHGCPTMLPSPAWRCVPSDALVGYDSFALMGPGAHLAGVSAHEQDLHDVDLSGAVLADASLELCDLSGANLNGAYLRGASLAGANLAGATTTDAVTDATTTCPDSTPGPCW